jgi:opacity protein-like surface antigen
MLAVALRGTAEAQARGPRQPSLEIDAGIVWAGGVDFGSIDATLQANQTPRAPYTLFKTSSTLSTTAGFEGRLSYHFTRTFSVEGAFAYSRPTLETEVSGDAEGVPATTARERLSRFLVDVSGVVHIRGVRLGRAVPFVLGGAGYLRELHEGDVLAETGHSYHAGGGLKIPFVVRRGFIRTIGLRGDARARFRSGGADLDRSKPIRTIGEAAASLMLQF